MEKGFGTTEDLDHIEEQGCIQGGDPDCVSEKAMERGKAQLGTLGSGNHFVEVICYSVFVLTVTADPALELFKNPNARQAPFRPLPGPPSAAARSIRRRHAPRNPDHDVRLLRPARRHRQQSHRLLTRSPRYHKIRSLSVTVSKPLSYLSEQLASWREAGTFQRLRQLESPCEPVCRFDGREVINLASNNYLGLANHPKLVEAAIEATRKYGVGSGAVRTIAGTMTIHMELERRIAALQERRGLRGLPVRLRGQRRHGLGDSRARGPHHLRRAEPRQHHRRMPPVAGEDPRLPAQGHRPRARRSSRNWSRCPAASC